MSWAEKKNALYKNNLGCRQDRSTGVACIPQSHIFKILANNGELNCEYIDFNTLSRKRAGCGEVSRVYCKGLFGTSFAISVQVIG